MRDFIFSFPSLIKSMSAGMPSPFNKTHSNRNIRDPEFLHLYDLWLFKDSD